MANYIVRDSEEHTSIYDCLAPAVAITATQTIPLFDVALKGVKLGYSHCFRSLPADISQTRTLCETYEFLCVDVLGGKPITAIIDDLKAGKTDYELEYKRYIPVKGSKSKARDMALVLVYLILLGEFTDEAKDTARIFNAVLFVVSHSGTSKWKTRKIVRAAYEDRFVVSPKQMATLDKWNKEAVEEGDDVTTEEEDHDDYYGSDGYDKYDSWAMLGNGKECSHASQFSNFKRLRIAPVDLAAPPDDGGLRKPMTAPCPEILTVEYSEHTTATSSSFLPRHATPRPYLSSITHISTHHNVQQAGKSHRRLRRRRL